MTDATMLFGILLTVAISMTVLQAFKNEANVSDLSDKRFRDMENRFKDLLAETKSEMDDKYTALHKDHIALTERFEKIEIDNMALKDSVSSLKQVNIKLENRFHKLTNGSFLECTKSFQSEIRVDGKPYHDAENYEDSNVKRVSDTDTKRQEVPKSNDRHRDTPEKRLLLPVTSTPSAAPLQTQARVAFHARLSQHLKNVGDYQHIEFNNVTTNVGNAYEGATSTFVCPVSGTYVFHWTILSYPDKYLETELVLNGNAVGYTYSYNDHRYSSGSNMVVLDIQEHDMVWVRVHGNSHHNGTVAYSSYSTFSGFVLWSKQ